MAGRSPQPFFCPDFLPAEQGQSSKFSHCGLIRIASLVYAQAASGIHHLPTERKSLMVLVLKNEQMENLLPMSEEIEAIEQAFRELGEGKAMNAPRARLRTPWKEEGGQYYFNNIMGLVPGVKSMALRIDSSFSKEIQVGGSKRRIYPGDFIGLVMLFDMDTCEILALMDDHHISTMRVRATSAVAGKSLARKDSRILSLLRSSAK